MDSATSKKLAEQEKQAEIRRQIALLQAQLDDGNHAPDLEGSKATTVNRLSTSPKRKRPNANILVPDTPSKKKRVADRPSASGSYKANVSNRATSTVQRGAGTIPNAAPTFPLPKAHNVPPAPQAQASSVLQKLAQAHKQKGQTPARENVTRSESFSAPPAPIAPREAAESTVRDENLALVEELTIGPHEHKPPFDDPHFDKLEPNSGIRLSSRVIPHDDFQDHLRGRYYLSPSKLYSVVRLLPNKQGYDVPVEGDWLTIAVVAERGKIKHTQAPVGISRDDQLSKGKGTDDDRMDALPSLDGSAEAGPSGPPRPFQRRQKPQEEPSKPGKKYVNIKLIDFGCRSRGSSADGGKAKIRGDAFLSLLLFESDMRDTLTNEDGTKRTIYRGGSRGAFERMSKLREGAVVALLNPKILKPFQRSADKPHPTENILAITPESEQSIAVIGYAQDLGMCRAMKRDGTRCTSWCDKRVSDVCDFHIQHAVERMRASRPEFTASTSGMSTTAKKKPAYDPARQWGLKPEPHASSATYVVSGHVVSGSGSDPRSMYVGETHGREAQAKAARKLAADSDKTLQRLLSRDKEGTKALLTAREFTKKQTQLAAKEQRDKKGKGKEKVQTVETTTQPASDGEEHDSKPRRNAYSATLIKQLGFDPTAKEGRSTKDANVQSKLASLAAVHVKRKIELGPRPGKKSSCVHQPDPPHAPESMPGTHDDLEYADDVASTDDELEREELVAFGRPMGLSEEAMIDLDDSDGDT